MADNKTEYDLQGLDEYIRHCEPERKELGMAWQTAIGLQKVDGLTTSEYLIETARKNIDGEITLKEAKQLIDGYYQSKQTRLEIAEGRTEEADKVSARIAELLSEKTFSMTPGQLISIHRHLFEGIYKFAGRIRDYNITKREWVLRGETVFYSSYVNISENLDYDIRQEREFSYANIGVDEAIRHITRFCSNLWQIHAFGEGNTRSTAVFMIKYLQTLGFKVTNDVFAHNSWYFRNALVRANYNDITNGITETTVFLERFFRNMLLGEKHALRNREMHLDWNGDSDIQSAKTEVQSANPPSALPPKCKNCTLEEMAIIKLIIQNPNLTQKEMATEIGRSERTVKSITVRLTEKGIITRTGGKRNGHWEINSDE